MARNDEERVERRKKILEYLSGNPFATDEKLAEVFRVSINTIRLDRNDLKIKEHRERIKEIAKNSSKNLTSLNESELIGKLIKLKPGEIAISCLETKEYMTFDGSNIVRGHYIYSLTEEIAIAVIPTKVALVGVANIKYKKKVHAGEAIYATAEVKDIRLDSYIVWVKIHNENKEEVFAGKFILKSIVE